MQKNLDENKIWMSKGNIGCTFASLFARNPEKVGWNTIVSPSSFYIPKETMILSLQFPNSTLQNVRKWALRNGFYEEIISNNLTGLRRQIDENIAWVQYFGPDSHVVTRQAPIPELMLCVKLPIKYYPKVGWNGILHLAHASVASLTERIQNKLWETSFKRTKKILKQSPDLTQAAKTTYKYEI